MRPWLLLVASVLLVSTVITNSYAGNPDPDIEVTVLNSDVENWPESDSKLLKYELKVRNLGSVLLDGVSAVTVLQVYIDGHGFQEYPNMYWYSGHGHYSEDCPAFKQDINVRLSATWRICFNIPEDAELVSMIIATQNHWLEILADGDWHCTDGYTGACSPTTLAGEIPSGCWVEYTPWYDEIEEPAWGCAGDVPDGFEFSYASRQDVDDAIAAYYAVPEPEPVTVATPSPTTSPGQVVPITYQPTDNAIHYGMSVWAQDNESTIINHEFLDDTLILPDDLTVEFADCFTINAFYSPTSDKIIMCHEFLTWVAFTIMTPNWNGHDHHGEAVASIARWVFMHELGHALIDQYDLPITGKEENVADQFATIMLLVDDAHINDGPNDIYQMLHFFAISDASTGSYWDRHGFTGQRYYDVMCLLAGKYSTEYPELLDLLPASRAVWCEQEYEDAVHAWDTLLADYLKQ